MSVDFRRGFRNFFASVGSLLTKMNCLVWEGGDAVVEQDEEGDKAGVMERDATKSWKEGINKREDGAGCDVALGCGCVRDHGCGISSIDEATGDKENGGCGGSEQQR